MDLKTRQLEYEQVVDDHLRYFSRKAMINTWFHNLLQLTILLGAIALPFILHNSLIPASAPLIVSFAIALSAGLENYFKFGQTGNNLRTVCRLLTREKRWYRYEIEQYRKIPEEQRFDLFMKQVETHISDLATRDKKRREVSTVSLLPARSLKPESQSLTQ